MGRLRIHDGEGFDEGVLRAAAGEIAAARESLSAALPTTDELVHDARKHIKRARALLRLGALPTKHRRSANELLRDAGRALSPARDRRVVGRLMVALAQENPSDAWLARVENAGGVAPPDGPPPIDGAAAKLDEALRAVSEHGTDRSALRSRPIQLSYLKGRDAMRAAASDGQAPDFHEWRKRAKDLRYQMEFLAPLWPGVLDAAAAELAALTDLLGEANNVGLLMVALENAQPGDPPPHELLARLTQRRAALWRQALEAGERIYAAKPKRFAAQIMACWRTSRG
jgi:CHAD domain-containing protein